MIETKRRLENLLHPGVKDPAQQISEVYLLIWVFVPVNTFKSVSSDSQAAAVSELTRLSERRVQLPSPSIQLSAGFSWNARIPCWRGNTQEGGNDRIGA